MAEHPALTREVEGSTPSSPALQVIQAERADPISCGDAGVSLPASGKRAAVAQKHHQGEHTEARLKPGKGGSTTDGESFSGRTAGFDPANRGSNPLSPATPA